MQDERHDPNRDAQEGATAKTPEEANTLENHLNSINVIQQNALVITGHKVKENQAEPNESDSERWL